MSERVTAPGRLPRLQERIAEVLRDVVSQVQDERPVHDHRKQQAPATSTASSRAVTRSPASGIRGMLAGWRCWIGAPDTTARSTREP